MCAVRTKTKSQEMSMMLERGFEVDEKWPC
jgi:hypothetical protein